MDGKRKHKQLSLRKLRRVRRSHAIALGKKASPGFQHLNWFDANIAAFLAEHGGKMPKASDLVFGRRSKAEETERSLETA